MPEPRGYVMRPSGREEAPRPEPTLEEQIERLCHRIAGIERAIQHNQEKRAEMHKLYCEALAYYVEGYDADLARLANKLKDAKAGLQSFMAQLPEGRRRFKFSWRTYFIEKGRKSVEVADEDKALDELNALGPDGRRMIRAKESVDKKALMEWMERGDAPAFDNIRVVTGDDILKVREGK